MLDFVFDFGAFHPKSVILKSIFVLFLDVAPRAPQECPKRLKKTPREPFWELQLVILGAQDAPKRLPREPKLTPRGDSGGFWALLLGAWKQVWHRFFF